MKSLRWLISFFAVACLFSSPIKDAGAQSPSVLYTWNGTGNSQQWFKNFGTNTVTLSNSNPGELTIAETGSAGTGVAVNDAFNRVRESPTGPSGGLDLAGLSAL